MSAQQSLQPELEPQEKAEVETEHESTLAGRTYRPLTDIFETSDALVVQMEIPGVEKDTVEVTVEKNVLSVTAHIALSQYGDLKPLYTEYGVGHFERKFELADSVDRAGIHATVQDGVLTLTLPKAQELLARTVEIQ